jgi:hypothetical protein
MQITEVTLRYGELRSTGFPSFSNKRVEVEFHAELHPGETAQVAIDRLYSASKLTVNELFKDPVETVSKTLMDEQISREILNQRL